ncbi:MAG: prolyl-tRNA synthetase associated domain-containing protein [Clostridia bacterium]|nr:prolyl-tRNA synthetase associated domain-containing protein [Clostridia bacterium]
MNKEIFERLEQLEIKYEKIEHPVMFTMEEIAEYGLNSHSHIPKNLVLRDVKGTRNMLVLVHGDKRADLRLIRDEIDSTKLSFASDERLDRYLKVEKGSVSPFGIIYDTEKELEIYFDSDLKKEEIVGCHPNDNRATLFLKFDDLVKYVKSCGHTITYIKV